MRACTWHWPTVCPVSATSDDWRTALTDVLEPIRVVWSEQRAQEEVERLNALNNKKGVYYFYVFTRVEAPQATEDGDAPESEGGASS